MTTTAAEQMQEIWEATAKERAQDKAKEQAKAKAKAKRHARYIAQRYATSFARSAERQRMGRPPICRDLVIESHGIDGKASQHDIDLFWGVCTVSHSVRTVQGVRVC